MAPGEIALLFDGFDELAQRTDYDRVVDLAPLTDEDVDTARLIMELDRTLGRPTDSLTRRVAATPAHQVQSLLSSPPRAEAPAPAADPAPAAAPAEAPAN